MSEAPKKDHTLNVAIISAVVVIFGYFFTAHQQQQLEYFKIKADAYSRLLNSLVLDANNMNINQLNGSLANLYMYAPDCVIQKINDSIIFKNGKPYWGGIDALEEVSLILHQDVAGTIKCDKTRDLTKGDFPFIEGLLVPSK